MLRLALRIDVTYTFDAGMGTGDRRDTSKLSSDASNFCCGSGIDLLAFPLMI